VDISMKGKKHQRNAQPVHIPRVIMSYFVRIIDSKQTTC